MSLTGKNFIGADEFATSNSTFMASDPLTGELVDPLFFEATQAEIEVTLYKATEAFRRYAQVSQLDRADFLDTIAANIANMEDEVIKRCKLETGLSRSIILSEKSRTISVLQLFSQQLREGSWVDAKIDRANPERAGHPKPDIRSMEHPVGTVVVFGASNFPLGFSIAGPDVVSALASGCSVIAKAYSAHAGTSEYVARAILDAARVCNMPDGVFSLLQGESVEIDMMLASHHMVKAIAVSGAMQCNHWVVSTAKSRSEVVPVYAETGSLNPVLMFPEKLGEDPLALATELGHAVLQGSGQYCTKPGLILLQKGNASNRFKGKLTEIFTEAVPSVMFSEDMMLAYHEGIYALAREAGVEILANGDSDEEGYYGIPHLFSSSILTFISKNQRLVDIFGPVVMLVEVDDMNELVEFMNTLDGHLAVSVFATDAELESHQTLMRTLVNKAGRVIRNAYSGHVEICNAMVHGGPGPATTDSRFSIIGSNAIIRFTRPVCFQDFPDQLLPDELKNSNPLEINRVVDGKLSHEAIRKAEES